MLSSLTTKPFPRRTPNKVNRTSTTPQPLKNDYYSLEKSPRLFNTKLSQQELSKMVPNHIIYDKETLYEEVRELKIALNKIIDENTKLKTKIAFSQSQQQRVNKSIEFECEESYGYRVGFRVKEAERQSIKIALQMEQLKKDHQKLSSEMSKIKKSLRYTQMNELQLHLKILLQENSILSSKNEQLTIQLQQYKQQMEDYKLVKTLLQKKQAENKANILKIEDLHIQIMNLERTLKKGREENFSKEKRIRSQKKKQEKGSKTSKLKINPTYEEPNDRGKGYRTHHIHVQPLKTMRRQQLFSTKLARKQESFPFFTEPRQKTPLKKDRSKTASKNTPTFQQPATIVDEQTIEVEENIDILQPHTQYHQEEGIVQNQRPTQLIPQIQEENKLEEKQSEHLQGKNEEVNNPKIIVEEVPSQKQRKISETDKLFSQIELSEAHYKIQSQPRNMQTKQVQTLQNPTEQKLNKISKSNPLKKTFHPPKPLKDIKTLLTYRFAFQKYPYSSLYSDILNSQAQFFNLNDLCFMMVNQPFYLTVDYSLDLIRFILEKQSIKSEDNINKKGLLLKLKEMIGDFKVLSLEQQCEMIEKCSELFKLHQNVMRQMFKISQNGENTVSHSKMIEILSKCDLTLSQIEFLIAQTSISSQDLQHLNYSILFQRFLNLPNQYSSEKEVKEDKGQDLMESKKEKDEESVKNIEEEIVKEIQPQVHNTIQNE